MALTKKEIKFFDEFVNEIRDGQLEFVFEQYKERIDASEKFINFEKRCFEWWKKKIK